jgi:hypothetical protein
MLANFVKSAGCSPVVPTAGDLAQPDQGGDFYARPVAWP